MLTVNSFTISQFQRCKRIEVIGQTHTFDKWRPQSLLGMCMRYAVFSMSNGMAVEKATQQAVNYFMAMARSPGLDVDSGIQTYTLAADYCAIIRNFLEYLSRIALLTIKELKPVQLSATVQWQFLSHIDESGILHKWEFVDYLPEDILPHLHGWEVFGDVAASECPMVLHLVAVGKRTGSHQASPWCRIYGHPKLGKIYRFKKRTGLPDGDWKPVYFSGSSDNKSKDWVDLMDKENLFPELIRHVHVKEVSPKHVKTFRHDVLFEADTMSKLRGVDPKSLPLSRYACDHPYTCPHQLYCYTDHSLDSVGIYTPTKKKGPVVHEPVGV